MTHFLVDSDGIIDYLNGVTTTVALLQKIDRVGDALCTCDVVPAEVDVSLTPLERVDKCIQGFLPAEELVRLGIPSEATSRSPRLSRWCLNLLSPTWYLQCGDWTRAFSV